MASIAIESVKRIGDKPLGIGSFSEVWKCKVDGLGSEPVAVKYFSNKSALTDDEVKAFEQEVKYLTYVVVV